MASVEYGFKILANKPAILDRAKTAVEEYKKQSSFTFYKNDDWTKLLIDFKPLGVSPDLALARLEKRGIYAEFSDGRYILFYLSANINLKELTNLEKQIIAIVSNKKLQNTFKERPALPESERSYSFQYALKRQCEWIDLDKAVGRMCAKNAGLAPPCIPVVVTGEMITSATVSVLSHKSTYGLKNGQICVVKEW